MKKIILFFFFLFFTISTIGLQSGLNNNLLPQQRSTHAEIDIQGTTVRLYPNAGDGFMNLEVIDIKDNISVEIVNIIGQTFYRKVYKPHNTLMTEKIDLSNYPGGIYLVKVQTQEQVKSKKFLIH